MKTPSSSPRGGAAFLAAAGLPALLSLACSRPALQAAPDAGDDASAPHAKSAPEPASAPPSSEGIRIERDGLAITFDLLPRGGEKIAAPGDASAVFKITSATDGAPVRGLRPLAWMSRHDEANPAPLDDGACRAQIKRFLGGLLSVRADVDMNSYLVWTLNQDNTISVINPQISFGRSKLLNLITLPGAPADWAMHPDRSSVYVSIPGEGALSIVDARRNLATAKVPVGAAPNRVAVAQDGQTVWVGNDGDGTVSVIDAKDHRVLATLDVGKGHHELAFAEGGRTAWITSADDTKVTVVDTLDRSIVGRVEVGPLASAITASDTAARVFIGHGSSGEVSIVDAARREAAGRVALKPGLSSVRFEPKGRFAFALNPAANEVSILDASTGKVAHTLEGLAAPDAVTFTDTFGYVRNRGAARVSLVDLASLERPGAPVIAEIPIGQTAPGGPKDLGGAPIAKTPEGNSVLVASPADKALYFYVEGMMAPVGTHLNYGREPRSLLIVDRTLTETAPGVYTTSVRLNDPGRYDVELALDSPRITACLSRDIADAGPREGGSTKPRLTFEALFQEGVPLQADEPQKLRFRLQDPGAEAPINPQEIMVMLFRFPGNYQQRLTPTLAEDGVFEVTFTPPAPGQYRFLAGVPGRGALLGALPFVTLGVERKEAQR